MYMRLPYPEIDPILISIGPLAIRWYALAYIAGIVIAWWLMAKLLEKPQLWRHGIAGTAPARGPMSRENLDDMMFWATLGIILGGRLGWVIFYQTDLLWAAWSPLGANWGPGLLKTLIGWLPFPPALMIWQGGMSFHGGLLGVILLVWLFCRRQSLSPLQVGDLGALVVPIGLFFGRLANFINGELYGRYTDAPWAMVFPNDPLQQTRHPSQLYEAGLEGLLLFVILMIAAFKFKILRFPGVAVGIFLAGYGAARFFVEHFREPDATEILGLTRGMFYSLPMVIIGCYFIFRQYHQMRQPLKKG